MIPSSRSVVLLILIFLWLLSLPGCVPVAATSQFYTDQDIVYDPALNGRWILYGDNQPPQYDEHETGDAPIKMTFSPWERSAPPKSYELLVETIGAGNEMNAALFQLEGERFLDITPSGGEDVHRFLPNLVRTHTVLRVKQEGDVLILAYLNQQWVADEVPADRRHAEGLDDENPVLLLPTVDLQKLLRKALKARNGFYPEYRFSKKDSESSARDLADYGYRMMAQKFIRRGDYEAALNALNQAWSARPDNHDTYAWLALMQTANGNGAAARNAVSEWIRRCRQVLKEGFGSGRCPLGDDVPTEKWSAFLDVAEHELLGVSYFAESNWTEAEREFETAMRLKPEEAGSDYDDDLVLYRSLVLIHLDKKTEATSLLDRNRSALGDQGKILADYLEGKVKDEDLLPEMKKKETSSGYDTCQTECRTYFFIACRYFAEGNREKAREWFQKTLELKKFADLPPVIARLRLKELAAAKK